MSAAAPVTILQLEPELRQMLDLYTMRQPASVLEVGTYMGGTLWYWLQLAPRDRPVRVVCVDTFQEVDNRQLFPDWCPANVQLILLQGRSQERWMVELVRALGPFDWVFIDADHRYEQVRADWENYGPLGQTVVLHDIAADPADPVCDVPTLWQEIQACEPATLELVDNDGYAWGGIGVVFR